MSKLFIPVLLGTTREGRKSEAAAKYIEKLLNQREEVESVLVDPRELNLPGDGHEPKDAGYGAVISKADAFFIVTPEYNHSFPGSLKRMLDSEYPNYKHKPVALAGVSSGPWGGIRTIQSLIPVLRKLGMVMMANDVMVTNSDSAFDDKGNPTDEHVTSGANAAIDELVILAKALQGTRTSASV